MKFTGRGGCLWPLRLERRDDRAYSAKMYTLDDYDYRLPESLIAQAPSSDRDGSRLLHLKRSDGSLAHRQFVDIVDLLRPTDLLVVNDTRVVPGRLHGHKETGGKVELLILDYGQSKVLCRDDGRYVHRCLIKASKRAATGMHIRFDQGLVAEVLSFTDGVYTVAFSAPESFDRLLERVGRMPLPPYIKRDARAPDESDRERYQTVYARNQGAVAAPTAGLHFTEAILAQLQEKRVAVAAVTLHVGYGTFVPVRAEDIRDHRMHEEWFSISKKTADMINRAKAEGCRVIAVGTTSVRTLEYAARSGGRVWPGCGRCDLFIYPGYAFSIVDAMITNFHLPRSTLLMLVSAFAGRETMLRTYAAAVRQKYRFFSYGDAMLIE